MSKLDKQYLIFLPRNLREINRYGYYNPNRLAYTMAMALNPRVVVAGSEDDYATSIPLLASAYYNKQTLENDRAHYLPGLIAYGKDRPKYRQSALETAREEIPHAIMTSTGRLPYDIIFLDFILGGSGDGLHEAYITPGTFENATHGLHGSPNNKFDFNGKDKYIPGLHLVHSSKGALYWIDLFNKGNIDELALDVALDAVYHDQLSNRTDRTFDTIWDKNNNTYARWLKKLGVTDGGDIYRLNSVITEPIGLVVEGLHGMRDYYNALKDETDNRNTRIKSAKKRVRNDIIRLFDNFNPLNNKLIPAVMSWNNILQRPIVNVIKKAIPEIPKPIEKVMKGVVKPISPAAKQLTHRIWDSVPEGRIKGAIRSNPVLGLATSAARRLGLF